MHLLQCNGKGDRFWLLTCENEDNKWQTDGQMQKFPFLVQLLICIIKSVESVYHRRIVTADEFVRDEKWVRNVPPCPRGCSEPCPHCQLLSRPSDPTWYVGDHSGGVVITMISLNPTWLKLGIGLVTIAIWNIGCSWQLHGWQVSKFYIGAGPICHVMNCIKMLFILFLSILYYICFRKNLCRISFSKV